MTPSEFYACVLQLQDFAASAFDSASIDLTALDAANNYGRAIDGWYDLLR